MEMEGLIAFVFFSTGFFFGFNWMDTVNQLCKSAPDVSDGLRSSDEFFSIMAHDLKTPLNSILG
jgi:signal transduction histidine kinase